jgi:hypothetical protein
MSDRWCVIEPRRRHGVAQRESRLLEGPHSSTSLALAVPLLRKSGRRMRVIHGTRMPNTCCREIREIIVKNVTRGPLFGPGLPPGDPRLVEPLPPTPRPPDHPTTRPSRPATARANCPDASYGRAATVHDFPSFRRPFPSKQSSLFKFLSRADAGDQLLHVEDVGAFGWANCRRRRRYVGARLLNDCWFSGAQELPAQPLELSFSFLGAITIYGRIGSEFRWPTACRCLYNSAPNQD